MNRRPTLPSSSFTAFADLTARPDSIEITDRLDSEDQRHTLHIGVYEVGAHLTLYLTPGSLEALRDAITNHLASGDPDVG